MSGRINQVAFGTLTMVAITVVLAAVVFAQVAKLGGDTEYSPVLAYEDAEITCYRDYRTSTCYDNSSGAQTCQWKDEGNFGPIPQGCWPKEDAA